MDQWSSNSIKVIKIECTFLQSTSTYAYNDFKTEKNSYSF